MAYSSDALSGANGSFIARIGHANQESKYEDKGVNDVFSISVTGDGKVANVMKETSVTVENRKGNFVSGKESTIYAQNGKVSSEIQSISVRAGKNGAPGNTTAYETNGVLYSEPGTPGAVESASRLTGTPQPAEGTVTAEALFYSSNNVDGMDATHQSSVMKGDSFEAATSKVSECAESVTTEKNLDKTVTRTETASMLSYDEKDPRIFTGWDCSPERI